MKKLTILFIILGVVVSANHVKASDIVPDCEYWKNQSNDLALRINKQKEKLSACKDNCMEIAKLISSLEIERQAIKQRLEEYFYGCSKPKPNLEKVSCFTKSGEMYSIAFGNLSIASHSVLGTFSKLDLARLEAYRADELVAWANKAANTNGIEKYSFTWFDLGTPLKGLMLFNLDDFSKSYFFGPNETKVELSCN